jgi:hypothetical protein
MFDRRLKRGGPENGCLDECKCQEGTEGPSAGCGTSKDPRTEPSCQERTEKGVQGMRQERRHRNRVPVLGKDPGAE